MYSHWQFPPFLKQFWNFFNLIRFIRPLNKDFSVGIQRLFGSEVTNAWFFALVVLEGSQPIKVVNSNLLWVTWDIKKVRWKSFGLLATQVHPLLQLRTLISCYLRSLTGLTRNLFCKWKSRHELLPFPENGTWLRCYCSLMKSSVAPKLCQFSTHF